MGSRNTSRSKAISFCLLHTKSGLNIVGDFKFYSVQILPMIAEIADVASCAVLDRMTANIQNFRLRFPFSDASPVVLLVNQLSVKACGQLANSAMMILESGEQISVVSANLL